MQLEEQPGVVNCLSDFIYANRQWREDLDESAEDLSQIIQEVRAQSSENP